MKTVLSVQDLSCVGRCSLTVALPVLSAMGIRCSVLPTAVLSTHTGFPAPCAVPLTDKLQEFDAHWEAVGVTFDAVTTGYLAGPDQAQAVLGILARHRVLGSRIIVDPAMADHGRLYSRLGSDHVQAMSQLCGCADVLLPNVTEAALLTGLPYRETGEAPYLEDLTQALRERFGGAAAVITGVTGRDGTVGFYGADRDGSFNYRTPVVPRQCHGTGDLFAAVFTGSLLRGQSVKASAVAAADFVRACVANTPEVTPHGVEFEPLLGSLAQMIL